MTRSEYLLTLLQEEAGEIIQVASKAKRFGFDDSAPGVEHPTNSEALTLEIGDLLTVVDMLIEEGHIEAVPIDHHAAKRRRIEKYMRYSEALGRLQPEN